MVTPSAFLTSMSWALTIKVDSIKANSNDSFLVIIFEFLGFCVQRIEIFE
jgi:hypothetical protein